MEKHRFQFAAIILSFGVVAFSTCIAAEFKRTTVKDLKLDGKLCYLPGSPAFGLGMASLICFSVAQITGSAVSCWKLGSRGKKSGCTARKQTITVTLLLFSWISFGFAVALLSSATSMNQRQPYGKGWLDGECYLVKGGVYVGSAILVLITLILILGSLLATSATESKSQVEQGRKVHAQLG